MYDKSPRAFSMEYLGDKIEVIREGYNTTVIILDDKTSRCFLNKLNCIPCRFHAITYLHTEDHYSAHSGMRIAYLKAKRNEFKSAFKHFKHEYDKVDSELKKAVHQQD